MHLSIVLVAPARAENIGAAARAMKTMGFTDLRIVDSTAHLEPAARWVAHGSGDILDNITTYATLADALHDISFTVATTARSRAKFHYYATPAELVPMLEEKSQWLEKAALVFGREDSGLTNEELELADVLTGAPMVADYPSLNLGQAVMVYCYQLASLMQIPQPQPEAANENQLAALRTRVQGLLSSLGVADDQKMADWLQQRLGRLEQRDTAMLHRLLHDSDSAVLPVGVMMPESKMEISAEGELIIWGKNVMRGYLGLPQENAEKLLHRENEAFRGYRTGDLGYEAGLIYCQGRNDSQVKLNGYRIEINEIENRLLAMSGINEAVVMPLMKPCGSVLRIAAFCVTELAPDTIKTSLSKVVPHYMVPSQIIVKDALPLNPNGKIDRKLLDAYARTN